MAVGRVRPGKPRSHCDLPSAARRGTVSPYLCHTSAHLCPFALRFSFLQEPNQILFPNEGQCVGAVAASARAGRNYQSAAMLYAFDFALKNPKLGRID